VLLGDLATIRGHDLSTVRILAHFPLPGHRKAGTSRRYLRRDIERMVAKEVPVNDVRWLGADAVSVQPYGIPVPGAALEQTARIGVLALLAPHGHFRVQAVNRVESVLIPPGQLTMRVRPVLIEPHRSTQSVSVDVLVDGELVSSTRLSFLAQLVRVAPGVASRASAAAPRLSAGSPAAAASIATVRAVVRGQQVTVRSEAGPLQIEGRAEALEDAAQGQSLSIRTAAGLKVRARVLAPGQVEVAP